MEMTDKQIIDALRCTSSFLAYDHSCVGCPYRIVEEWSGNLAESCNVDQICQDAAGRLQELTKERDQMLEENRKC